MALFENLPPSRYHEPSFEAVRIVPFGRADCVRSFNIQAFMTGGPFAARRLERCDTLVLATGNKHKLNELAHSVTLRALFNCLTTKDLNLSSPDETGTTYFDNAAIKALDAAAKSGFPALGDDRGVEVDAHGGLPGVDTIEWLKDKSVGFGKIEEMARTGQSMRATSVCAMALAWPDGVVAGVEVYTRGSFVWPGCGENGFSFDPLFRRNGEKLTYGQMNSQTKYFKGEIGDAIRYVTTHLADAFGHHRKLARPVQQELFHP